MESALIVARPPPRISAWTLGYSDYTAPMPDHSVPESEGAVVTVEFVRGRNAVLVRGDLISLFIDYYLHLADHGLKYSPEQDRIFKEGLAAFTLHCASHPQREHIAWTLNFQEPRLNLFLAGDNEDSLVVGRLFTENVREADHNFFYSDVVPRRGAETRRSVVNFAGADVLRAVEACYRESEQRTARLFDLGEDHFAMLVSHPDCDTTWFESVGKEALGNLQKTETLALIERRSYRWACGCGQQKILAALAPAARTNPDEVFGVDEVIHIQCPRCAALHTITREAMEAYLAQTKPA